MLKVLTTTNLLSVAQTKCGEIFYHNINSFTIFCTLCQLKSFHFDEFLLHVRNIHFENVPKIFDEKNEQDTELPSDREQHSESLELKEGSSFSEQEEDEQETLMVLKKSKINRKIKYKKKCTSEKNRQAAIAENLELQNNSCIYSSKDNFENISSHAKKNSKDTVYPCLECSAIYTQKKHLDEHVYELHNGYKCPLCDKRFRRSYHVASHTKIHTSEKKFTCPHENCGRGFTEELYLQRHLEVHTMERNFLCNFKNCDKAFHTKRRLASHQFTHRIPKKFVCDVCGHSCRSNIELTIHQRVHTGEKPFPCEICEKPFKSKVALKEHMISHSQLRPHICNVCNASFTNRRVLIRHSFIHLEEKTFKCKLCERAFRHPNSLQGHMRNIHREPKVKKR
ncbi:uncharacterized protein ACRADG_007544 [Cochliomyia hominivorax]